MTTMSMSTITTRIRNSMYYIRDWRFTKLWILHHCGWVGCRTVHVNYLNDDKDRVCLSMHTIMNDHHFAFWLERDTLQTGCYNKCIIFGNSTNGGSSGGVGVKWCLVMMGVAVVARHFLSLAELPSTNPLTPILSRFTRCWCVIPTYPTKNIVLRTRLICVWRRRRFYRRERERDESQYCIRDSRHSCNHVLTYIIGNTTS